MKTPPRLALALVASAFVVTALAEEPGAAGGAVLASEPGKAIAASAVEVSAEVVGIDKATRTLSLKGPEGEVVDLVAGDAVKNFDQIKVGDAVLARYLEALTLELRKSKRAPDEVTVSEGAAKAEPGEKPAVAAAGQVNLVAEVVAVEPKKSTITLKGPLGNAVTLNVQNPAQFDVVEVGDQVEVTYTEAVALSVERAAKQ